MSIQTIHSMPVSTVYVVLHILCVFNPLTPTDSLVLVERMSASKERIDKQGETGFSCLYLHSNVIL